jgi:hypothetical protein
MLGARRNAAVHHPRRSQELVRLRCVPPFACEIGSASR